MFEVNFIAEGLIHQINMNFQEILGEKLQDTPKYQTAMLEEKRDSKWGVGWTLSLKKTTSFTDNSWIYQRTELNDPELPLFYGLYDAITIEQKKIIPSGMELGIIVDQPIPGGFVYGSVSAYLKNVDDERDFLANPLGELVEKDKRIFDLIKKLPTSLEYKKYKFQSPHLIFVLPWGDKTLASVSCMLPVKGNKFYWKLPDKKRKFEVYMPKFKHLPYCLEILKRLKYYVTQVSYTKEIRGKLSLGGIKLPWLMAMMLRAQELESS